MGPRPKSGYRTKISGGSAGASGKRSIWGGLGTNRTGATNDDEDMKSLSTELGMLAPHALHAREKHDPYPEQEQRTSRTRRGERNIEGGAVAGVRTYAESGPPLSAGSWNTT